MPDFIGHFLSSLVVWVVIVVVGYFLIAFVALDIGWAGEATWAVIRGGLGVGFASSLIYAASES
jgi:hypothetical protein